MVTGFYPPRLCHVNPHYHLTEVPPSSRITINFDKLCMI